MLIIPNWEEWSQLLDIFKEAIIDICLKFIGQLLRRNTVFFLLIKVTMWHLSCCVWWCRVTEVTWLLHYVTYLRTYLLHLQQPSLPLPTFLLLLQVEFCDKRICVTFCLLHSFQTIYKSIFKIANIVVSEWWSLQTYPYHIGFRGRIKSVFGRKKQKPCGLEWCWGLRLRA